MQPFDNSTSTIGKILIRRLACSFGCFEPRRSRMKEGLVSSRRASSVPKSVSADIECAALVRHGRTLLHRSTVASGSRGHERHHVRLRTTWTLRLGKGRYRQEISTTTGNGKLSFANGLRSISQGLAHIFGFKIRIGLQNLRFACAFANHCDHSGDGDPQSANARDAPHLTRIYRDAAEWFHEVLCVRRH